MHKMDAKLRIAENMGRRGHQTHDGQQEQVEDTAWRPGRARWPLAEVLTESLLVILASETRPSQCSSSALTYPLPHWHLPHVDVECRLGTLELTANKEFTLFPLLEEYCDLRGYVVVQVQWSLKFVVPLFFTSHFE
jgi:hypothetical protein